MNFLFLNFWAGQEIDTRTPARFTEVAARAADVGTVEAGRLADLIVVDGDPTEDISDIRKVEWTIKDGTLYDTAKLYQAVSIRQ